MLTKFQIFFCLILTPFFVQAQKNIVLSLNYLPQITGMLNKDDGSYYGELYQYRTTYDQAAGLQILYYINDKMGLGTGMLFSSEGQSFVSIHGKTIPGKKRMDYLKIPLQISLNTNRNKKIFFKANAGLQLNYLIKADGPIVIIDRSVDLYDIQPAKNSYFHKLLFAATLGAGMEYKISEKIGLGLTLRADYAFTDAEKKSATFQYPNSTAFNFYTVENPNRPKTHNYSLSPMLSLAYKIK